jgi:hypothetical protein
MASWEPARSYADHVWMALPQPEDEATLCVLLPRVRQALAPRRRTTSVNYPAGQAVNAFRECGFRLLNTLVWMEHPLSSE